MTSISYIGGVRRTGRRALAVALLVLSMFLVGAPAARGHAAFVSSRPEPGVQLQTTPGVVEVEFSEPLIVDLSSMAVVDPDGRRWERTGAGRRSMRASLGTTSPGVYEVEWKTVSPIDGHTLRGSYRFGVGVTPTDVEATATTGPQRVDLLLAVARTVEYAGLLAAVGMWLLSGLAGRAPRLEWVRVRPGWALGVALAAGIVVVVGEALIAAAAPTVAAVTRYLSAEPGIPRLTRLAAVAAALAAVRFGARGVAGGAMAVAIAALAAGGHAAAGHPAWWAITVDAVHLLAAGLWAGGILALATLRPAEGWRGQEARRLLERFSPVAVWAFGVTVAFGTLRGAQELTAVSDLVTTSYGRVLAAKVAAVALMVPLSLRAWRRRAARPRVEGLLAVVAITAAAMLAAYPVPPQRAAEDAAGVPVTVPSLPRPGDLTLGGATGDVLVGLTVRPGREGRNDVYVHLLPPGGQEEADGLTVELSTGPHTAQLQTCGATCRHTTATVEAGDVLAVRIAGVDPPAGFTVPDMSAADPDAQALIDKLDARMGMVDSLRYDEVFGPVEPPLRSTAEIVVPDRLRFTILTLDRETIRIGETMYRRGGDGEWEIQQGPPVQVPSYIWDYPRKVAPRIVGTDRVDGVDTDVVSFFIDHSSGPIWYRLWVDDEGLVRRAEMRARGHFMDHRYYDFGAPITIEPPVPSATS